MSTGRSADAFGVACFGTLSDIITAPGVLFLTVNCKFVDAFPETYRLYLSLLTIINDERYDGKVTLKMMDPLSLTLNITGETVHQSVSANVNFQG